MARDNEHMNDDNGMQKMNDMYADMWIGRMVTFKPEDNNVK